MSIFRFYSTILDEKHTRVVDDIDGYLGALNPVHTTSDIYLVAGADALTIQYNGGVDKYPNYAVAVVDGANVAYYHVVAKQITENTVNCELTLDVWAMAVKYGDPRITGTLVSGHELPDVSRETHGTYTFPVTPIAGNLLHAAPFGGDDDNTRYKLQALASVSIKDGDITRQILIATPPYNVETSRTAIRSAVSNMARATELSVNNNDYDIMSIGKMWLVPQRIMTPTITANASIKWGDAEQSLPVIYSTANFSISSFGDRFANDHALSFNGGENTFVMHRIGNYSTYFDAVLTGDAVNIPVWDFTVDFTSGHFAAYLTYCGVRVDFSNSLVVTASASKTQSLELTRQISDAIGILSGAGSIAVGVATGSPVAVAHGVMSTAATIGGMVGRVDGHIDGITGNAFSNMASATYAGGTPDFIPAYGFMFYSPSNGRAVLDALSCVGYVGAAPVASQSMHNPINRIFPVLANRGAYRKYENVVIDCAWSKANEELRRMAVDGYTVYYTSLNPANAGAQLECALNLS